MRPSVDRRDRCREAEADGAGPAWPNGVTWQQQNGQGGRGCAKEERRLNQEGDRDRNAEKQPGPHDLSGLSREGAENRSGDDSKEQRWFQEVMVDVSEPRQYDRRDRNRSPRQDSPDDSLS